MEPRFSESVDLSEVVFTRFQPGDDLMARLVETVAARGWERAAILSGIGSLTDVAFVAPRPGLTLPIDPAGGLNPIRLAGPLELLSIEGNLVPQHGGFGALKPGDPVLHVHCILSSGQDDGLARGGHLLAATVFTTVEIFIARVQGSRVKKQRSAITGLNEMRADL
ncbi:MAG: PPC domain-containing DNA-binding protein [Thermodesulfobacteriota bacterium]